MEKNITESLMAALKERLDPYEWSIYSCVGNEHALGYINISTELHLAIKSNVLIHLNHGNKTYYATSEENAIRNVMFFLQCQPAFQVAKNNMLLRESIKETKKLCDAIASEM